MALATRASRPGLLHHAERGGQSASQASTHLGQAEGIRSSMSRTGPPSAKAHAESFITTVKAEDGYRCASQHRIEARGRLGHFLAEGSHEKRRHSALGSQPPAACERWLAPSRCASLVISPHGFTPVCLQTYAIR